MRMRVLFWTGVNPDDLAVRDVILFNEYSRDIIEEFGNVFKNAFGEVLYEVLKNIK